MQKCENYKKWVFGNFKPLLYIGCSTYVAKHMKISAKNINLQAGLIQDVECEFEDLNYSL